MKKCLIAALLALLATCPAYSADPAAYDKSGISLKGGLLDATAFDMDGDGLKDIVAVSLSGDGKKGFKRAVEIFYQKKNGRFAVKADLGWDMDRQAAVFDVGEVAGDGKGSVCYLAPDGMYCYPPEKSGYSKKPARLIRADNIFTGSDPADMPRHNFLYKDEKGRAMALVPGISGLGVYVMSKGAFARISEPELPVTTNFTGGGASDGDASLTVSHRLPVVRVKGFDRPSASDIIMNWEDNALVYLGGADGYSGKADLSFAPGLVEQPVDDPMEGAWLLPADVDGDGRTDFVVTKKTGGVAHTRSLIFIYLRAPGGGFPEKPSHTIITEGVVGPRFVDLNGDGRLDILLPSIKVGVSNFINMLTSGTVNVEIDIYMQDGKGVFPDRPNRTKSVSFKLDLKNLTRAAPVMETGRFTNGAGYGLAVVSDEDTLSLYLPDRYSVLSDRPGLKLEAEAPTGLLVDDLNGDGMDDLILTYKKSDKLSGRLNVFVSIGR